MACIASVQSAYLKKAYALLENSKAVTQTQESRGLAKPHISIPKATVHTYTQEGSLNSRLLLRLYKYRHKNIRLHAIRKKLA